MNLVNSIRFRTLPLKIRFLKHACRRIELLPEGKLPDKIDLLLLMLAWGNIGYAAGFSYLRHMAGKVRQNNGPILECGSGASTLLIATLTCKSQTEVVVLENSETWHRFMLQVIQALGYEHVRIVYAPLVEYEDFSWYQVSAVSPIAPISLVICDGPPAKTQGGRFGLLPVMKNHFAEKCTVLLDDSHRQTEQNIIGNWCSIADVSAERVGMLGRHAELTIR